MAPTWSTITLTAWATMSWSSRAIRARSSATAMRVTVSRSRSASPARTSAAWVCSAWPRTTKPASQQIPKRTGMKTSWLAGWPGTLSTTHAAPTRTMTSPTRACRISGTLPSRNATTIPSTKTLVVNVSSCPSTKVKAVARSQ